MDRVRVRGRGCKAPAQAAEAAADALGWELRVVDGQLDPRIYNRAVSEAIDQGYDAVILNALSVDAVAGAVQRARAAGIVVGSWDGGNEPSPHGVTFEVDQPIAQQGANMASYMIWKSGGNTNAYLTEAPEFNVVRGWIQVPAKRSRPVGPATSFARTSSQQRRHPHVSRR